jgi:hypothetical protein
MSKRSKTVSLFLTGGLGNQLFQLAAGLSISQKENLYYESTIGKPRKNASGEVQIECFELPKNFIRQSNQINSNFLSKVFGYILRSGFNPHNFEKYKLIRFIYKGAAQLIFSIYLRRWCKLQVGQDIGFTHLASNLPSSTLVGYFQSSQWMEDPYVFEVMNNLSARDFQSRDLYQQLAQEQKPILIHVRLTDYLGEDSFGLLDYSYFEEALLAIQSQRNEGFQPNVWVFSDDIGGARKLLSFLDTDSTTWFSEIENCPVKTLEVMRMCDGFVIGNSTFSWWAAALRFDQRSMVCFPNPWFKSAPTPLKLTSESWYPISAQWR